MRLRVDTDVCTGHAVCQEQAPDLIQLDSDGYNITAALDVPAGQEEAARRSAAACPEMAILIDDDGPGATAIG